MRFPTFSSLDRAIDMPTTFNRVSKLDVSFFIIHVPPLKPQWSHLPVHFHNDLEMQRDRNCHGEHVAAPVSVQRQTCFSPFSKSSTVLRGLGDLKFQT